MISLSTRASLAAAAAVLAVVAISALSPMIAVALAGSSIAAGLACVAFAAQSRRLQDEQRLVYRPVYVRRHDVQRRVTFRDE